MNLEKWTQVATTAVIFFFVFVKSAHNLNNHCDGILQLESTVSIGSVIASVHSVYLQRILMTVHVSPASSVDLTNDQAFDWLARLPVLQAVWLARLPILQAVWPARLPVLQAVWLARLPVLQAVWLARLPILQAVWPARLPVLQAVWLARLSVVLSKPVITSLWPYSFST